MAIEGLVTKDVGGRIVVEYLDIARIDLSALMTRAFDKFLGSTDPAVPGNVIPIQEAKNGQTRRTGEQQHRGLQDADSKGSESTGGRSEEQGKEAGSIPDETRE